MAFEQLFPGTNTTKHDASLYTAGNGFAGKLIIRNSAIEKLFKIGVKVQVGGSASIFYDKETGCFGLIFGKDGNFNLAKTTLATPSVQIQSCTLRKISHIKIIHFELQTAGNKDRFHAFLTPFNTPAVSEVAASSSKSSSQSTANRA